MKERTLESAMDRYMYGPDMTPEELAVMKDRGIFADKPGRSPRQQTAFQRYEYAKQIRTLLNMSGDEPDT